ncbi:MAG: hypothetical protein V7749_01230, partial [Cocleimonas sp.]
SESGVNTDLNTNKDSESGVNTDLNTSNDIDLGSAFTTRSASKAIIRVKTPAGHGVIATVYLPMEPDTISVSLDVGSIITVPIKDVLIIGYE